MEFNSKKEGSRPNDSFKSITMAGDILAIGARGDHNTEPFSTSYERCSISHIN